MDFLRGRFKFSPFGTLPFSHFLFSQFYPVFSLFPPSPLKIVAYFFPISGEGKGFTFPFLEINRLVYRKL
ncbi:MAG: hypothetical protein C6I01_05235 [Epsilonproteobacteria bacterium]|nr:hypothetical protein [Campylobacterota bacterium]